MDKFTILETYYGYHEFRKGQEELIDQLLSGRDSVAIMPTGAGKSICYQIPALLLPGITLVISPLISLMQDQVNALVQNGIAAAYINSSLTANQYQKVLQNIKNERYKIIYIAPERLLNDEFLSIAQRLSISMISIDEAHCISHWGQDFRPSYLKIIEFANQLSTRPILSAFTATATKEVQEDIIALLQLRDPFCMTTGFDRKNLYFEVRHPSNKKQELSRILLEFSKQTGIIYCNTRKHVEEVCTFLQEKGFSVGMYHAGMSEQARTHSQQDFLYDKKQLMVATNAFGMGIDKSNVSFVIHYNMPKDMESYYQEAGRAGRDGSDAKCILLYGASDVKMNQFLIDVASQKEDQDKATALMLKERDLERLKTMTFYCHSSDCLRHSILQYFGEQSESYCGNCYNCTHNFEELDITIEAQKILSCIKRMKERFGAGMVSDVLRGRKHERLVRAELHTLSTFGIMQDCSAHRIREIIQYLTFHGYILVNEEEYRVLYLSEKAKDILLGKQRLSMKIAKEEKIKIGKKANATVGNAALLDKLRVLRAQLAKQQHVPAYIIFNDATLVEMSQRIPQTKQELLSISGVGETKLKRYGTAFLELLTSFAQDQ